MREKTLASIGGELTGQSLHNLDLTRTFHAIKISHACDKCPVPSRFWLPLHGSNLDDSLKWWECVPGTEVDERTNACRKSTAKLDVDEFVRSCFGAGCRGLAEVCPHLWSVDFLLVSPRWFE